MSNQRINIGLYVSNLVDVSVYSVCKGASAAAKNIGANLIIFPGMHLNGDYNDPLKSPYYYQYNTIYEMGKKENIDFLIIMTGIIGNTLSESETLKFIRKFGDIPVMTISSEYPEYHSIKFDNKTGLKKSLNHLIHKHNCRNIAFVGGSRFNSDAEERLNTFYETLLENGLPVDHNLIAFGDFSEYSDAVVEKLLTENPHIDAICFANDEMAKGGYRVLSKFGYITGRNISVTGFDNSQTATDLYPMLTTVNADNYQLGYLAVEKIPDLIDSAEVSHIIVPTSLIVRNSCGCTNTSYENLSYVFSENKLSKTQLSAYTAEDYINYLFRDSSRFIYSNCFTPEQFDRILQVFSNFFEIILDYHEFINPKQFRKLVQNAVHDIAATGILNVMPADELYNVIDIIQYKLSSQYDFDEDIRLVFSQIYREFSTYNHTLRRQELKSVLINDSVINYIVNDVIITEESGYQSLRPIMTRLHEIGISRSYMYLFETPVKHNEHSKFDPPEKINLVYSMEYGDIRFLRKNNEKQTSRIINDDLVLKDGSNSLVICPLFSNEEIYGFLICDMEHQYYQYLNKITLQIGTALKYNSILRNYQMLLANEKENSRNFEKISKYDELTGIFNRRGYFDSTESIIHSPANEGKNAVVIFADMDNLKTVNDQFGHDDGDFSLKSIASILSGSFRTTDIVGRIGGDEFAAFALLDKTENINQILSRITETAERFNDNCDKPYYVSMSIGMYPFVCGPEIVLSEILEKADELLYKQKQGKRKNIMKEI